MINYLKLFLTATVYFVLTIFLEYVINLNFNFLFSLDVYILLGIIYIIWLSNILIENNIKEYTQIFIIIVVGYILGVNTMGSTYFILLSVLIYFLELDKKNQSFIFTFLIYFIILLGVFYLEVFMTSIFSDNISYNLYDLFIKGPTLSAIINSLIMTIYIFLSPTVIKKKRRI